MKVAIVTGSASGIGRATAVALADAGHHVTVNYTRSEAEARETAALVAQRGREALVVRADVADDAECRRLVDETVSRWGRIDVLVNNAGTTAFVEHRDLDAVTDEMWERIFAVNVKGAFSMARAAASALRASGRGAIVNVSSVGGARSSSIPYSASKAALNDLTLSLARVLAPAVRVNAVAPGFVDTRWIAARFGDKLDAVRAMVKQRTPLGDAGRPEQVAQVILSLVGGMDWVTGQVVVVDGGMSIS